MDTIFGLSFKYWIIIGIIIYLLYQQKNENFSNESTTKKIYNFNTSWCGWSKRFQPEWNKFTNQIDSTKIIAIDVKCDDKSNEMICKEFNVPGYPSVVAVVNGKHHEYTGPRNVEALTEFITNLN